MNKKFLTLRNQVEIELESLEKLLAEKDELQNLLLENTGKDKFYLRAAGSLLQDFYTGIEEILKVIIREMDGSLPASPDWHKKLLQLASKEVEPLRPAIITRDIVEDLHEYLRFRHLFRNLYGFNLKGGKLSPLLDKLDIIWEQFNKDIKIFLLFLKKLDS